MLTELGWRVSELCVGVLDAAPRRRRHDLAIRPHSLAFSFVHSTIVLRLAVFFSRFFYDLIPFQPCWWDSRCHDGCYTELDL